MVTTKKKLSIDELARRLYNTFVPESISVQEWGGKSGDWVNSWRRVARLARKLETQPVAKPRQKKPKPLACEACGLANPDVAEREWKHYTDDDRTKRFNLCGFCWDRTPAQRIKEMFRVRSRERAELARAKAAAKKSRK